ncbi:unnamed protein product [Eruca vesicaria subsp. sativa]|uniref:F-box domain-containing protein n=1 Tax=Eruca vesicaria subsp. sativa TaxID=29727 RepID=A0ABC8M6W9_ERUVS|nr:unnamed protein product [Eruca vesicaria subsp. sativa]
MASHSPSSTTITCKRSTSQSEEAIMNPSFSDLPSSLLEVIMSRLTLKDNIFASAACKSWCEAAVSTRVVEKHPWLLSFDNYTSFFELLDPVQSQLYTLNLPELAESTLLYSAHGWLLMHSPTSDDMFFFNPFTRERISLPEFALPFQAIAFSCPPASEDCVVVALNFKVQYCVTISTCHPGATEWITSVFPAAILCYTKSKLVYLVDRFYCFNVGGGYLYSFLPSSRTWVCHEDAYYLYSFLPSSRTWDKKETFLAEKEGQLFLVFTCGKEKPVVYKQGSLQWEEMSSTELDGFTIFFSSYYSELRTNLPLMRNNLCSFDDRLIRCLSYSYDKSRYNPHKESLSWLELVRRSKCLWIDPPDNVLDYLN